MSKFAVASLSITHRIVHLGYNVVHIPHCCFKKGCWKKGQKCMWQSWKVTGYQCKMYKLKQFIKSTMLSHPYSGIFCDFPEILRSSNCDLKTTNNFSFWGCCMHLSGFFPNNLLQLHHNTRYMFRSGTHTKYADTEMQDQWSLAS